MTHWTAEADIPTPGLIEPKTAAEETNEPRDRQHQPDDHYGLHNFAVFQSLLKRHLNLQ